MTESESSQRGSARALPPREASARRTFAGAAVLSALSLVLPAAFVLVAFHHGWTGDINVPGLVLIATIGLLYIVLLLRTGDAGPVLLAGTSTALCIIGLITVIPALLYLGLERVLGGAASTGLLVGVLVYTTIQYVLASTARRLAGAPQRMRTDTSFQLGAVVPLVFLFAVSGARSIPARLQLRKYASDAAAREAARADLFAIHACAAKHRGLDPRHEYPPSLQSLGPEGSACLAAPIARGDRNGWRYEYRATPVNADSAAPGFTVQAGPVVAGQLVPMLSIDEQGLIREGYLDSPVTAGGQRSTPGLDILVALGDCERSYRESVGHPPATLTALRAFADSIGGAQAPNACLGVRGLGGSPEWLQFGKTNPPDEWPGTTYVVTWTRAYRNDSSVTAFQAQPVSWGKTGVWNYLLLSSGAIHATLEQRHASAADAEIPRCEFGAPPAGAAQCVPGSSPPPSARLVVDSVVDEEGFAVKLADARDASAEGQAAGFQYAFSCSDAGGGGFTRDSARTCRAPWGTDSISISARIRNRDLSEREYTQRLRVRHPPLGLTVPPPRDVELGDVLELLPAARGRNPRDQLEYTVRIGDAKPTTRWLAAAGSVLHCRAATTQQGGDCLYPARPGTYRVSVTARDRHGDSTSATTEVVLASPRLLRLPPADGGRVQAGGEGDYLVLELLVSWPAEHGQTRLVRDALGAGDIGPEPPRIGSVTGSYPERAERASDGATVVPIGFSWSELLRTGALKPGAREIVLDGRRGHVHDFVPYRQRLAVRVE